MKAILLMQDWRERKEALDEHREEMAHMIADPDLFDTDADSGESGCKTPLIESKFACLESVIRGCEAHIAVIEDQITEYYNEACSMVDKMRPGSESQGEMEELASRLEAYVIEIDA